jgi:hypothetical protein
VEKEYETASEIAKDEEKELEVWSSCQKRKKISPHLKENDSDSLLYFIPIQIVKKLESKVIKDSKKLVSAF